MCLETLSLEHLPPSYTVHVAFFRNLQNAAFLQGQLVARNASFEYAFVDAAVVLSRSHLLSAVFKACHNAVTGALKTPNVHSEIVLCLSPSSNIADAYRRFGITAATRDLLVVKVTVGAEANADGLPAQQIFQHLTQNVQGDPVPATDQNIAAASDVSRIAKCYKLNALNWLDCVKDEHLRRKEIEMIILSSMALRGV